MKSFKGAVLFVDLLGFGFLTRGRIDLSADHYAPWEVEATHAAPHQLLAATILLAFRRALVGTRTNFPRVEVAQLSDCAFLWSKDLGLLIDAGRHLMQSAVEAGLLCRGGLAYGDILVPGKVNRDLGRFIVGDAVTRAVDHEKLGKGMRIFTDAATVSAIKASRNNERWLNQVNPLTADSVDEWAWYQPPQSNQQPASTKAIRRSIERMVSSYMMLRHSPKFSWNSASSEGRRQLACSSHAVARALSSVGGGYKDFRVKLSQLLATGVDLATKPDGPERDALVQSLVERIATQAQK